MKSEELQILIDRLDEQINPLLASKMKLTEQKRSAESKEFIKSNKIKKQDVQTCGIELTPFFWNVFDFGEWCKSNSTKPWICWNGSLYATSEIQNGRMDRHAVARYEDLDE